MVAEDEFNQAAPTTEMYWPQATPSRPELVRTDGDVILLDVVLV
jgi:hypothetical protein